LAAHLTPGDHHSTARRLAVVWASAPSMGAKWRRKTRKELYKNPPGTGFEVTGQKVRGLSVLVSRLGPRAIYTATPCKPQSAWRCALPRLKTFVMTPLMTYPQRLCDFRITTICIALRLYPQGLTPCFVIPHDATMSGVELGLGAVGAVDVTFRYVCSLVFNRLECGTIVDL
jgi:hypothetical protein